MANIPIRASSEQLMTAAKASEDSAQCVSSASLNDIIQSISTKDIGSALEQVFPENWSEVLGEIYSTMVTDSAQMEQLTTNQSFEEFKKSLRDIKKRLDVKEDSLEEKELSIKIEKLINSL